MRQYYITTDGSTKQGPIDEIVLRANFAQGAYPPTTMVWTDTIFLLFLKRKTTYLQRFFMSSMLPKWAKQAINVLQFVLQFVLQYHGFLIQKRHNKILVRLLAER